MSPRQLIPLLTSLFVLIINTINITHTAFTRHIQFIMSGHVAFQPIFELKWHSVSTQHGHVYRNLLAESEKL